VDGRGEVSPSGISEPVSAQTVDALYRALLGREPDPDGLRFWVGSASVEALLRALTDTDRHRERLLTLAGRSAELAGRSSAADVSAFRLSSGDGLVTLEDRRPAMTGLAMLPWSEVADRWGDHPTLTLGPYGSELASELVRRNHVGRAVAGLAAADAERRIGAIVLTEERYVSALADLRPQLLHRVMLRILHPVSVDPGTPADEVASLVRRARERLHALGFIEVSQVFTRRYKDEPVTIDTTYTMPDAYDLHTVEQTAVRHLERPSTVWLVGRRVPVGDSR
jgi:CBS domain-containing protein